MDVSISNSNYVIFCRNPNFIRIGDNDSQVFSSFEEATKESKIKIVCYTHSSIISNYQNTFQNLPSKKEQQPKNPQKSEEEKSESTKVKHFPIKLDTLISVQLCIFIPKLLKRSETFYDFVCNSTLYPGFYLYSLGYDLSTGISVSFYGAENLEQKTMEFDYYLFTMWIHSLTRILKVLSIVSKSAHEDFQYESLLDALYGTFAALPVKSTLLTNATFQITVQAIKSLHSKRGENDSLYFNALKILKFVIGYDFDTVLRIAKTDVPRSIRSLIISFETCSKLFTFKPFKTKTKATQSTFKRFERYYKKLGIDFNMEMPDFKYEPFFVQFHNVFKPYLAVHDLRKYFVSICLDILVL